MLTSEDLSPDVLYRGVKILGNLQETRVFDMKSFSFLDSSTEEIHDNNDDNSAAAVAAAALCSITGLLCRVTGVRTADGSYEV